MSDTPRVLFLCTRNACRSAMAEGWLRHVAPGRVHPLSAGTDPGAVDPRAVAAMAEIGIDISAHRPRAYADVAPADLVIAVCDAAAASCPAPAHRTLAWPFPDPAAAAGAEAEIRTAFRRVRDDLGARIRAWVEAGFPPLSIAR